MREQKTYKNRKKHTAAGWIIPVLIVCVFVLSGLISFGRDCGQESVPSEEPGFEVIPEEVHEPTEEEIWMEFIKTMSLEEKVGQLFLIHYPDQDVTETVKQYHPGGLILFAKEFKEKTPESVQAELAVCQDTSGLPLLTAVDEEGGDVNRISWYSQYRSTPFQKPQSLYAEGGMERIEADTLEKCQLLTSLGINVNVAPVCDVSEDPSAYIYSRTFGKDGAATAEYADCVVTAMTEQNVGSVLKHFPGYGGNSDTHKGFSVDHRPYSQFEESDFLPFEAGIAAGAGAVMVSHNIVESMDDKYPSSLSPEVHRILREELGFQGVIMTDDLAMKAISDTYGLEEAAVMAVNAGNDMLCCTEYEIQIPAVIAAAESGEIREERINESVLRVLLWKQSLGLAEAGMKPVTEAEEEMK